MKNDVIFGEIFEKNWKITSFPLRFWISFENRQIRSNLSGKSIIFDPKFQNPCVMTHSIARIFTFWYSLWFAQKINKNWNYEANIAIHLCSQFSALYFSHFQIRFFFPPKSDEKNPNQIMRRKSRISRFCALKSQLFHSDPCRNLFTRWFTTVPKGMIKIQKTIGLTGGPVNPPGWWAAPISCFVRGCYLLIFARDFLKTERR